MPKHNQNQKQNQKPAASDLPLNCGALETVPYLDQYWGVWALYEPFAQFLQAHVNTMNVALHVEQHAEQRASSGTGSRCAAAAMTDDGIAVFELTGTLMKHLSSLSAGTSMALARRQVRAAMRSDDVRGALLYIDSPGGTLAGTTDLAADLTAFARKKPLFAFIEDLGASAGYWLATPAQRIAINSTGLAGSIGVFQVVEDTSKLAEQKGVTVHVVRYGAMKGLGTPGTPVTEEQLAYLQARIDSFGDDFVNAVASGRKLSRERAFSLADGRVHKGPEAKQLGLVDAVETIDDTLALLRAEINKPRSRTRTMSEAAIETNQPSAATLAELRDACPGASSDFLLEQIERSATVATAMKAHMQAMAAEKAALAKERDELKAKAEAKPPDKPKRGVEPIGGDAKEEEATDCETGAHEKFIALVEAKVAAGIPRDRAVQAVVRSNPQLHDQVVREANGGRRAA